MVSLIFREGNSCTSGVANLGIHEVSFIWSDIVYPIKEFSFREKFDLPSYRFCFM